MYLKIKIVNDIKGGVKMPIEFYGLLEDVQGYKGKNGFGANITVSQKVGNRTKRLEFRTNNEDLAIKLEALLDTNVKFVVSLEQNNFGLRLSEIIAFEPHTIKKAA